MCTDWIWSLAALAPLQKKTNGTVLNDGVYAIACSRLLLFIHKKFMHKHSHHIMYSESTTVRFVCFLRDILCFSQSVVSFSNTIFCVSRTYCQWVIANERKSRTERRHTHRIADTLSSTLFKKGTCAPLFIAHLFDRYIYMQLNVVACMHVYIRTRCQDICTCAFYINSYRLYIKALESMATLAVPCTMPQFWHNVRLRFRQKLHFPTGMSLHVM